MLSSAALTAAAAQLASPKAMERERAEAVLLEGRDASVPLLVQVLSVHGGTRASVPRAALVLGAMKARAALPSLYMLVENGTLSDDDRPFVARAIAEIIEGQDAFDDACQRVLEKLAKDSDASTRAIAALAFGNLGDLRARSRVQALAQDASPYVREKASAVLARLAAQSSDDVALQSHAAPRVHGVLAPFVRDLADSRRAVRDHAVDALVRAGAHAVPVLLDALNQPFTPARIGAALALGRLQATEAAGPLLVAATGIAATRDEVELRATALRSLAACLTGQETGLAASLAPLAKSADRFVRAGALLCLGRLAEDVGMRVVVEALVDHDPFVAESAAVALSEGMRESHAGLVEALAEALSANATEGKRPAILEAILIALSRVPTDDPAVGVHVRHRVRVLVNGSTASMRKTAVALLEGLYTDADPPPVHVVDSIIARLHDDNPDVRVAAASFLRTHVVPGMTGAVAHFTRVLDTGELHTSLLILEALRRHDTVEAKAALEAARAIPPLAFHAAQLAAGFDPTTATWTVDAPLNAPRLPRIPRVPHETANDDSVVDAVFM